MKLNNKITFILGLAISVLIIVLCSLGQSDMPEQSDSSIQEEKPAIPKAKKNEYELAAEFLAKLKNEKTDTIIFYKRGCIGCCDFFNIFWSVRGQKYLTKFYFNDDMGTQSKTIILNDDSVFELLRKNFNTLKNSSIKENIHKSKEGSYNSTIIDHYCYTQLNIYTQCDSILTDGMRDHDFDMFTGWGFDSTTKRETNDNYAENTNSKWNSLLMTIEHELVSTTETKSRELETMLTTKNKQ